MAENERLKVENRDLLGVFDGPPKRSSKKRLKRRLFGRNQAENMKLESAAGPGDLLLRATDRVGPTGLMAEGASDEQLRLAGALLARYTDAPAGDTIRVSVEGGPGRTFEAQAMAPENADLYRV